MILRKQNVLVTTLKRLQEEASSIGNVWDRLRGRSKTGWSTEALILLSAVTFTRPFLRAKYATIDKAIPATN